jgi:hypothetical protein
VIGKVPGKFPNCSLFRIRKSIETCPVIVNGNRIGKVLGGIPAAAPGSRIGIARVIYIGEVIGAAPVNNSGIKIGERFRECSLRIHVNELRELHLSLN